MTPEQIYQQSVDKQRVVITGMGSRVILSLIRHVLKFHNRKFDYLFEGQEPVIHKDSPTIIIQALAQLLDYKHHIGVLSDSNSSADIKVLEQFAGATPKGGTLIYPENDSLIKAIGSKEKADIQSIPYKVYHHEVQNGKSFLVSSANEKIPVTLSGDAQLQNVSAAREVLRKLGITSSQFYMAVSSFQVD